MSSALACAIGVEERTYFEVGRKANKGGTAEETFRPLWDGGFFYIVGELAIVCLARGQLVMALPRVSSCERLMNVRYRPPDLSTLFQ